MACPICGANCKCRNRGFGGLCCHCHRHKPNAGRVAAFRYPGSDMPAEVSASLLKHKEWVLAAENVKTWGEVQTMSRRENPAWCPSRWTTTRVRRVVKHVRERALWEVANWLSIGDGCLFLAWFNAMLAERLSRDELHRLGVKTLGDTDGNTSTTPRE